MHSVRTARIKSDDLIQKKRRQRLKIIRERLVSAGIGFGVDKVGKITLDPPYEIFRCIKTNDIVVKQGNF